MTKSSLTINLPNKIMEFNVLNVASAINPKNVSNMVPISPWLIHGLKTLAKTTAKGKGTKPSLRPTMSE